MRRILYESRPPLFTGILLSPLLSPHAQLWLIGPSAIGFDLGAQTTLVAHQSIVYGIEPGARSRLNAVLFVSMFTGMTIGAGLGSLALAAFGWIGVSAMATVSALAALAVRLMPLRGQR